MFGLTVARTNHWLIRPNLVEGGNVCFELFTECGIHLLWDNGVLGAALLEWPFLFLGSVRMCPDRHNSQLG
jgi:hypothetical protein